MIKKFLIWLLNVNPTVVYDTKWLPKPLDGKVARVLSSVEFKWFIETCEQRVASMIVVAKEDKARLEAALLLEGVNRVRIWADELVPKEEPIEQEENYDLSEQALLDE